jgi:hypothetical protein
MYGGSSPRYADGALANAELVRQVFPGWSMRVYHDNSVPAPLLQELTKLGVELRDMTASGLTNQMTWRFSVASDPTVERFIVRDLDSRLSIREKVAVDEWVLSGKRFHVMRDHPSHSLYPMSGGMWGGTHEAMPDMLSIVKGQHLSSKYVADMDFLTKVIWPIAKVSVMQHDAFSCQTSGYGNTGWPMPRVGGEHIGSVYMDKYSELRGGDVQLLMTALKTQPVACKDRGSVSLIPPFSRIGNSGSSSSSSREDPNR